MILLTCTGLIHLLLHMMKDRTTSKIGRSSVTLCFEKHVLLIIRQPNVSCLIISDISLDSSTLMECYNNSHKAEAIFNQIIHVTRRLFFKGLVTALCRHCNRCTCFQQSIHGQPEQILNLSWNCKILDSDRLPPVLTSVLYPLDRISRAVASLISLYFICLGLLLQLDGFVSLSHGFGKASPKAHLIKEAFSHWMLCLSILNSFSLQSLKIRIELLINRNLTPPSGLC